MPTGTIKFYNTSRGFGFIVPDSLDRDIDADVFVGASAIERAGLKPLVEGDHVSFDVEPGKNGRMQATNLAPA